MHWMDVQDIIIKMPYCERSAGHNAEWWKKDCAAQEEGGRHVGVVKGTRYSRLGKAWVLEVGARVPTLCGGIGGKK